MRAWKRLQRVVAVVRPRQIHLGVCNARTGPGASIVSKKMAIRERSMINAEVLALEEINANGGLHGRRVKWVKADGRSDWPTFAREAQRLIDQGKSA